MTDTEQHFLGDEQATLDLGAALASRLGAGDCVYLYGDLGAGKTTLVRGLLRALGHEGSVKSPTYTLVEPYDVAGVHIYHFDLYRLGDPEELEMIGIRDYFDGHALCVLEWPERGSGMIPLPDLTVNLAVEKQGRYAKPEWGPD